MSVRSGSRRSLGPPGEDVKIALLMLWFLVLSGRGGGVVGGVVEVR